MSADDVESPRFKTSLTAMPNELLEKIFCYVADPHHLARTCKRIHEISCSPSTVSNWALHRFGRREAFLGMIIEHTTFFTKSTDNSEPGLETFKMLMKACEPVPRYQVQMVFQLFALLSMPYHITSLIEHGVKVYGAKEVGLNTDDIGTYVKLCTINSNEFLMFPPELTDEERAADCEILEELITKYHLDPNFYLNINMSRTKHTGYTTFLRVIEKERTDLFNILLKHGVMTYHPKKISNPPTLEEAYEYLKGEKTQTHGFGPSWVEMNLDRVGQWLDSGSRYDRYTPDTADAVCFATKVKSLVMLEALLEKTPERWTTPWGQVVLCACIQRAIDNGWDEGLDTLFLYFNAMPREGFSKSQRKRNLDIADAITSNNVDRMKEILQNGGQLTDSPYSYPGHEYLRMLIMYENSTMINTIFENSSVPERTISTMINNCFTYRNPNFASTILDAVTRTNQTYNPPAYLLKDCILSRVPSVLERMIEIRKRVAPTDRESQHRTWIKMAQRRGDTRSVELLEEWEEFIFSSRDAMKPQGSSTRRRRTKGQPVKTVEEKTEDEEFVVDPKGKGKKRALEHEDYEQDSVANSEASSSRPSSRQRKAKQQAAKRIKTDANDDTEEEEDEKDKPEDYLVNHLAPGPRRQDKTRTSKRLANASGNASTSADGISEEQTDFMSLLKEFEKDLTK